MDGDALAAIGGALAGVASGFFAYFKTRAERRGTAKTRDAERDDMEHRVSTLEADVRHLGTDITELKRDSKENLRVTYEIRGMMMNGHAAKEE